MQRVELFIQRRRINFTIIRKTSNTNYVNFSRLIISECRVPKSHIFANFPTTSISKYATKYYSTTTAEELVDSNTFEKVCEETLDSLAEYFEELIENEDKLASADVSYSGGVLTLNLEKHGTYVINRQSPNRQIWLSSPLSGPKRYDFIIDKGSWIYKHDNKSLFELLEKEISDICGKRIDFSSCVHK